LSALGDNSFAFYWKRNSNAFSRVKSSNFAYGTRATPDSADPETSDDIFLCPTRSAAAATGFCQVYNPSSNTEFGVFGAVANGTDYRVDWRVVNVPDELEKDPDSTLLLERIKVAGDYNLLRGDLKRQYQRGIGRGYGRHMGIREVNGTTLSSPGKDTVIARVGDIAKYVIIIVAGLLALKELGLNVILTDNSKDIILGSIALGAAVAFGLGGKDRAEKFLNTIFKK